MRTTHRRDPDSHAGAGSPVPAAGALLLLLLPAAGSAPGAGDVSPDGVHAHFPGGLPTASPGPQAATDTTDVGRWFREVASGVQGPPGRWSGTVRGRQVMVLADPAHDRFRVLSPLEKAGVVSEAGLRRMLEANFSSTMDSRYAIWRNRVWSVYVHRLGSLDRNRFRNAVRQVVTLAATYGGSYSAGGMEFGTQQEGGGDGG